MKKLSALLLCLMLLGLLSAPALAAPEAPVITMQPQSHYYPEYSVALYTVKATGTNLQATWYIRYQGKTYTVSRTRDLEVTKRGSAQVKVIYIVVDEEEEE